MKLKLAMGLLLLTLAAGGTMLGDRLCSWAPQCPGQLDDAGLCHGVGIPLFWRGVVDFLAGNVLLGAVAGIFSIGTEIGGELLKKKSRNF